MGGSRKGGGRQGGWSSGGWGDGWGAGTWSSGGGWGGEQREGGGKGCGAGRGGGGAGGSVAELPKDAFLDTAAVASRQAQLRVAFCPDPQTLGQKFTGTFDEAPELHFASLNAGDSRFFLGGATLNKQFENDLRAWGRQRTDRYQEFHEELFKNATTANCLTAADAALLGKNDNLELGFVRVLVPGERVGVVFIDVFAEARRPGGPTSRNVAMVYTVGPQRKHYGSDEAFIDAVRAMAGNLSAACAEYAALGAVPPIDVLRVFPVSCGAFAGRCDKGRIAMAICQGLVDGSVAGDGKVPIFEFAFDAGGDLFGSAWRAIQS